MHKALHISSFVLGAFLFAFGLLPLIGKSSYLGPLASSLSGVVLSYILAFGGLFIIFDSFFEFTFHAHVALTVMLSGLVVFAIGLIVVLHSMKVLAFTIPVSPLLFNILFIIEGLLLMVSAFIMF